MSARAAHDLVVIGGGLIGSAIAWGAARAGAEVALIDEGDVAYRASRGNFGLVWLQGKGIGKPAYMQWSLRAGRLWRAFAEELSDKTGIDTGWRGTGGLNFCFSEEELAGRRDILARMRADGGEIEMEFLDRQALRALVPGIGPEVFGASYSPQDSHVSPLHLLRALQQAFRSASGHHLPGAPVEHVRPEDGGFVAATRAGMVRGRRIVIAAGLGSARLAPQLGLSMPVQPERGQIVVTERVSPCLDYAANCLRQTVEGSFLLGSSHEKAGFDESTQPATAANLCRTALRVLPALAEAGIVRMWGSLRVMTPDGLPIYEESRSHPGAFAATCHSGVTLASVHALDIGPAMAAGCLPEAVASFTGGRFDDGPTH